MASAIQNDDLDAMLKAECQLSVPRTLYKRDL